MDNNFLVRSIKSGDAKAFQFLMDTHYRNLHVYANTLTDNSYNAEDIVQNVFVKIWLKRKKIDPNLSIKSYLYKSVYNEFIDQYRKKKPVIYLEKKYFDAIDIVIDNEHEDFEKLLNLLETEINKLPKKCKQVFILNKKEGLTHIEISEYLGVSIKTVEGHITRAFKILGKKLGDKLKSILFMFFDFKNENLKGH